MRQPVYVDELMENSIVMNYFKNPTSNNHREILKYVKSFEDIY